jgi:hypothetical protein
VFCVFSISLKMDNKNVHFRHILYFKKGKKAMQIQGNICAMYGADAVNEQTCRKWFARLMNKLYLHKKDCL